MNERSDKIIPGMLKNRNYIVKKDLWIMFVITASFFVKKSEECYCGGILGFITYLNVIHNSDVFIHNRLMKFQI
jgi:hypothetical protein